MGTGITNIAATAGRLNSNAISIPCTRAFFAPDSSPPRKRLVISGSSTVPRAIPSNPRGS